MLVICALYLIFRLAPRYGRSNILVYVTICNIIGALTVLCGKGLGITLKDIFSPNSSNIFGILVHPLFWIIIAANVIGIPTQVVYINKALSAFNTSTVIPIQYVCTNVLLIIGSMLLFEEFYFLKTEDCIGLMCGFGTIILGLVLLTTYKDKSDESFISNDQSTSLID